MLFREIIAACCENGNYLTLWSRVLLENPTVTQPFKKFPTFYGIIRSIAVSTRALVPVLSQMNPVHMPALFLYDMF
jgi:hypothetical protein